ncbi:MAG: shikimate kinase II, partial [Desulfovibrio sp.]|nr:shikimate kinase II [Desulfovibrio sp.]
MGDTGKRIFLVGPRASGKTTVGRMLAGALGWLFVDTDVRFENNVGMGIARFVAENGWPAFREAESRVLRDVSE